MLSASGEEYTLIVPQGNPITPVGYEILSLVDWSFLKVLCPRGSQLALCPRGTSIASWPCYIVRSAHIVQC